MKSFIWRLCRQYAPSCEQLTFRGISVATSCPWCSVYDETSSHLFLQCLKVLRCWQLVNLASEVSNVTGLNIDFPAKMFMFLQQLCNTSRNIFYSVMEFMV